MCLPCYPFGLRNGQAKKTMIIKEADDKTAQISTLQALQARTDCPAETRKRIEQEIRNIQAGAKGEREAAYEMGFHYGASKNWMLIHDLRIECDGRVAQIDHIAINRVLDIWVCESKHFSEGIAINEHGECAAFYGSKPYGVPSPFEQNRKHVAVLEAVFKTGKVKLPTRLGFNITPAINSLILVSKSARISRPKIKIDGIDSIIKNDQFKARIDKLIDGDNNPLGLAKLIGRDTLEDFARRLAALHRPIEFNWPAKFGLSKEPPAPQPVKQAVVEVAPIQPPSPEPVKAEPSDKPKQKLICHSCGAAVAYNVAKFCWFNKPKFGGNLYCMDCQKTASAP